MENKNMFEVAVRSKMRFPFKGVVSAEDLWDLSVENLDLVFKQLNSHVKQASEESLLNKKTTEDEITDVKIEIIKYIVGVKMAEEEARKQSKFKREQKQKILSIISDKQDADLQNKTVDELNAMLSNLE
jgi:hypothetical protein